MELIDDLPGELLETVFTHSSWAPDRASSYERLEFLGDSVLELAIARALYERYPDFSEGRMAKIRSHVVSRASCAVVSRELGLGRAARRASGRKWRRRTSSSASRVTATCSPRCSRPRWRRSTSSTGSSRFATPSSPRSTAASPMR